MAWQDVTPIIGSAGAKGRVHYKVGARMGCIVTLPPALVEELGWKAGTHLKLAVGGGEVFGKLKLCEEATALPVVTGTKGGSFVVRLGRWAQLPEREVDRIAVEHQVEGRALILALPQHALNVAPARAVTVEPGPRPVAAKVDVVERVVGRNGARPVALQAGTRGG